MSITERAKDMGVADLVKENKRLKNDLMQDMKEITKLEEENKNLRDINRELQRWLEQTEDIFKFQQEENKKIKKENEELQEYKSMYEGLIN